MLCTSDTALKKLLYILFFLHLILTPFYAQPSITWQRMYDGPLHLDEYLQNATKSTLGNFYLLYRSAGSYILKINPQGDTIWSRKKSQSYIWALTSTHDDGCVAIGETFDSTFIIKIDSSGNTVWYKNHASGGGQRGYYDLKKTSDDSYVACGYIVDLFASLIIKMDSVGEFQWERIFTAGHSFDLYSVVEGFDGKYYATGSSRSGMTDTVKARVLKIDKFGNLVWNKTYKINNSNTIAYVINKISNRFMIWGGTDDTLNHQAGRVFFAKLDTSGNVIYSKVIPSLRPEHLRDAQIINESKYVYTSESSSQLNDTVFSNMRIVDSSGNLLYSNRVFSTDDLMLLSVVPIENGDILFAGHASFAQLVGFTDVYAVRTDSILNFPPYIIGVKQISSQTPKYFNLFQNYPNPFNPKTIIEFQIPNFGMVELKVYDVLGREVAVLVKRELKAGTYQSEFDGTNYPSGVYFYRLTAGEYSKSKKMVLIK